MPHWTAEYVSHVLESKDWSMNRLADEVGLAASTINRPLRLGEPLSPKTVSCIYRATGIDPAGFAPSGLNEPVSIFRNTPRMPRTVARKTLETLDTARSTSTTPCDNQIQVQVDGSVVRIAATLNREGLAKLRAKLDAIEAILDD